VLKLTRRLLCSGHFAGKVKEVCQDPTSGLAIVGTIGNEVMVVASPHSNSHSSKDFSRPLTSSSRPVKEVWLIDPLKVKQHLAKWGKVSVVGVDVKGDIRREKGVNEWRRGGKLALFQIANDKNDVLMVDCLGPFETMRMFQGIHLFLFQKRAFMWAAGS